MILWHVLTVHAVTVYLSVSGMTSGNETDVLCLVLTVHALKVYLSVSRLPSANEADVFWHFRSGLLPVVIVE